VNRCNDLLFWDSTHNLTSYDYKLSSFTLFDSEMKSRPVIFYLTITENAEGFKRLLDAYTSAFKCRIPFTVMTDGDEAISTVISCLGSSDTINHLVCTFNLFDMNVKKKVQSIVNAGTGTTGWPSFRLGLSLCREASTEAEFSRLWDALQDNWLPPVGVKKNIRAYMISHVWTKRHMWATCYFSNSFKLGQSTTQRSE